MPVPITQQGRAGSQAFPTPANTGGMPNVTPTLLSAGAGGGTGAAFDAAKLAAGTPATGGAPLGGPGAALPSGFEGPLPGPDMTGPGPEMTPQMNMEMLMAQQGLQSPQNAQLAGNQQGGQQQGSMTPEQMAALGFGNLAPNTQQGTQQLAGNPQAGQGWQPGPGQGGGAQGGFQGFNGFFDPSIFPGSTPNVPYPYAGQGMNPNIPWNSQVASQGLMNPINALIPGFQNTIPPGFAGFDPNSRANQFNLMSGIFAGDPMELPGEQAGPMLGAAANMSLGSALDREQRNNMAQQGLLDAIFRAGNNPGVGGSAGLSGMLAQDPFTTSSDSLQKEIEGIITRGLANAREGALQSAQGSLGSSGNRGGESALLQSGLDFGSRAAQADAMGEARVGQAMRRAQDIQNAQGQFEGTSNIFGQSIMGPAAIGADFLSNRENVDRNALIEQMRAMAGLGMAENIRKDSDVSTLEAYMPGIVNLLGNLFGGMAGSGGGGGG